MPATEEVVCGGGGGVVICGTWAWSVVVVEWGFSTVMVTKSVDVAVGGGWNVMVMKVVDWVEDEMADGDGAGSVNTTVVAATVASPPASEVVDGADILEVVDVVVVDVVAMVDAEEVVETTAVVEVEATRPSTLDAVASLVHCTTTPAVSLIGIAKHADPVAHTLITKLPAWLQDAMLPERQAICPGVHGEEKLSVLKKSL